MYVWSSAIFQFVVSICCVGWCVPVSLKKSVLFLVLEYEEEKKNTSMKNECDIIIIIINQYSKMFGWECQSYPSTVILRTTEDLFARRTNRTRSYFEIQIWKPAETTFPTASSRIWNLDSWHEWIEETKKETDKQKQSNCYLSTPYQCQLFNSQHFSFR